MNILVTGGAGFIGSEVVDLLIGRSYEVTVWDDFSTGKEENLLPRPGLTVRTCDVADPDTWPKDRYISNYDVVVHCAAKTKVIYCDENPVEAWKTNVYATQKLAEACPNARFVFLSTLGAMYSGPVLNERTPPKPIGMYGLSKLYSETALKAIHPNFASLRLSNVFGERQRPDNEGGVVSIFLGAYREGEALTIFGDGNQTRDFIYVKDVARTVVTAAESAVLNETFHVNYGESHSVNQLADAIKEVSQIDVIYKDARPGELYEVKFPSHSQARSLLGFEPSISVLDFIRDQVTKWRDEK